jgi:hypothetical protein
MMFNNPIILSFLFFIAVAQEQEPPVEKEVPCTKELAFLQTLLLDLFPPTPALGENKPLQIDDYLANIR